MSFSHCMWNRGGGGGGVASLSQVKPSLRPSVLSSALLTAVPGFRNGKSKNRETITIGAWSAKWEPSYAPLLQTHTASTHGLTHTWKLQHDVDKLACLKATFLDVHNNSPRTKLQQRSGLQSRVLSTGTLACCADFKELQQQASPLW